MGGLGRECHTKMEYGFKRQASNTECAMIYVVVSPPEFTVKFNTPSPIVVSRSEAAMLMRPYVYSFSEQHQ